MRKLRHRGFRNLPQCPSTEGTEAGPETRRVLALELTLCPPQEVVTRWQAHVTSGSHPQGWGRLAVTAFFLFLYVLCMDICFLFPRTLSWIRQGQHGCRICCARWASFNGNSASLGLQSQGCFSVTPLFSGAAALPLLWPASPGQSQRDRPEQERQLGAGRRVNPQVERRVGDRVCRSPSIVFGQEESGESVSLERLSGPSWAGPSSYAPAFQRLCLPDPFFLCHLLSGLVQRCVIIQKDQHGFGFTVSGDRIVLVQSVRPGECCLPVRTRQPCVRTRVCESRVCAAKCARGACVQLSV